MIIDVVNIGTDGKAVQSQQEVSDTYFETDKQALYESRCQELIAVQYPPNEENKVVREYLAYPADTTKQQAFAAYNDFVESCKQQAYTEVYGS